VDKSGGDIAGVAGGGPYNLVTHPRRPLIQLVQGCKADLQIASRVGIGYREDIDLV
jgi:hypothetical protein